MKQEFIQQLKSKIWQQIPVTYPEKGDCLCYLPDFTSDIKIEKSLLKNTISYIKALKGLKKLDLEGLSWTYEQLQDGYSKDMMINVVVYKLLDKSKLRFPLCYDYMIPRFEDLERKLTVDDESITLWNGRFTLNKYALSKIGFDIKIMSSFIGIYIDFIKEQYRYRNIVKCEKDDVVIDGGACYGDTALYFASYGAKKVYSFEFLEENLEIFSKNLSLNPMLEEKIELVKNPLSDTSGKKLYFRENGPGTAVFGHKPEGATPLISVSIDDLVETRNIEKVDFIKLDIEGSEEFALKGAVKTIQRFKPKLAICVYHKSDDLWVIPQLIKQICPEYKLYLDHHTINYTETLIYAKI